ATDDRRARSPRRARENRCRPPLPPAPAIVLQAARTGAGDESRSLDPHACRSRGCAAPKSGGAVRARPGGAHIEEDRATIQPTPRTLRMNSAPSFLRNVWI